MKKILTSIIFLQVLLSQSFASSYPRQKIQIKGLVNKTEQVSLDVQTLEKQFPLKQIEIFDPYNKNIKTTFFGFYLKELFDYYAKAEFKQIKIVAIDG